MKTRLGSALVAAATTLCAVVLLVGPAAASASTRCGRVWIKSRGAKAKVLVGTGTSVSCHHARKLIKRAYHAEDTRPWDGYDEYNGGYWIVKGWRCSTGLGGSQTYCKRDGDRVDGSTRTDDGWNF